MHFRRFVLKRVLKSEFLIINKLIIKVLNPKVNDWTWPHSFDQKLYNYYTKEGFPISGDNLRTDNFIGKMVYYFEVKVSYE
jgi:hypothetical protein